MGTGKTEREFAPEAGEVFSRPEIRRYILDHYDDEASTYRRRVFRVNGREFGTRQFCDHLGSQFAVIKRLWHSGFTRHSTAGYVNRVLREEGKRSRPYAPRGSSKKAAQGRPETTQVSQPALDDIASAAIKLRKAGFEDDTIVKLVGRK